MGIEARFSGGEHYELLDQLGEGGEGVVYRARHRVRGDLVALKTIPVSSPERVLRLKREFRELRELRHPNIVRLHELGEGDGHWYYTMELVDGSDVLSYVRPDGRLDTGLLRAVLSDLARAIHAIHERGLVHRDLTPRNIMVTPEGRVVLIDLGVSLRSAGTSGEEVIGTAAYMAPEQAMGKQLSGACDWYSVGVILYEALYERLPFKGAQLDILQHKQERMPEFGATGIVDTAGLVALCERLLQTAPEQRGGADEILAHLGEAGPDSPPEVERLASAELSSVVQALVDARNGHPTVVLVHGKPGAGKTALVDELVASKPAAAVFRAACSADESVPFRALDGVVDAIVDYLAELPSDTAARLLPVRSAALVRAFPVFARIEPAARRAVSATGPKVDQEGLIGAFAELLAAIAERDGCGTLIIDDLHFADDDSLAVLARLLGHPATQRLLIVGTVTVTEDPFSWLETLHRAAELADARVEHIILGVDAADEDDEDEVTSPVHVPFGRPPTARPVDLGGEAQRLLEVIALGESPVPRAKAAKALGWDLKQLTTRERELIDAGFVAATGARTQDSLGLKDADTRRSVLGRVDEAVETDLHLRMARAFADEPTDNDRAARHFQQAGETARAAHRYALAADEAASVFACSRAVHLYDQALWLLAEDDHRRFGLLARSADSLAASGHLADAADRYIQAATESHEVIEALELKRCAADCYIRSGRVDEGIAAQGEVFESMGIRVPKTSSGALRSLVWRRLKLRVRGLRYTRRDPSMIPVDRAMRIDALLAAGLELTMFDFIRGGDFQARALLESLNIGDERRLTRALTAEAGYQAASGDHANASKLLARAGQLAAELDDPYLRASHHSLLGVTTLLKGKWVDGLGIVDEALHMFRTECTGAEWETVTIEHFARWALVYTGDFISLAKRVLADLRVSEERGDRLTSTLSRAGWGSFVWLSRDDPAGARAQYDRAAADWDYPRFLTPHWALLLSRVNIELYSGNAAKAYGHLEDTWADVEGSLFLRAESRRIEAYFLRARTALAMLAADPGSSRWRQEIEVWSRKLAKEPLSGPKGLASLCRAARANIDGDAAAAISEAGKASEIFAADGATLFEAVADAIAFVHDGSRDPGEHLAAKLKGVKRPLTFASMLAPGFSSNVEWVSDARHEPVPVIRIPLTGHLTMATYTRIINDVEADLAAQGPSSLLIDTVALNGYDAPVRLAFVAWFRANRKRVRRVAMVTDRMQWRMVTRTMALLANGEIKAFPRPAEAMAWASMS